MNTTAGNSTSNSTSNVTVSIEDLAAQVAMVNSNVTVNLTAITEDREEEMAPLIQTEAEDDTETEDTSENPDNVNGYLTQDWPADRIPTDYEAQCYLERYPDVQ
jgi:hypothetical protein